MSTDVEQLEQLATRAEEKAAAARAKRDAELEKELAKRLEREQTLDRQIVATATETRERLREESAALYQEILKVARSSRRLRPSARPRRPSGRTSRRSLTRRPGSAWRFGRSRPSSARSPSRA